MAKRKNYSKHKMAVHLLLTIIQHIDTLPKYGNKTLDVRRSTWRKFNDECKFRILKERENDRCL